jgi:hypothetical protein
MWRPKIVLFQSRPEDDPWNDMRLATTIDMVISADTGAIVRLGVVDRSALPAFDELALAVIERVAPFGKAPHAVAPPDGNVYVRWRLAREWRQACAVATVRPDKLGAAR